jgi:putative ABC transport system permease protein
MRDSLYLAWQYVCRHRWTTAILVAAITLIVYLPAALEVIVENAATHFRARAESTPLVVGARSSALELVLAGVYFDKPLGPVVRMEEFVRIQRQGLGLAIPLHTRFETRGRGIVGTTVEYAKLRDLHIAKGYMWPELGECLVGSRVAAELGLELGSKLPVASESAFSLGDAPLRLNVVGVLEVTETPDDEVVFVDLETAWVIEGLGHGHVEGAEHGSAGAARFADITKENANSFHFHGERSTFPISAVIVAPTDLKAATLLMGQYLSPERTAQLVEPTEVMDRLLAKVVMVRSYIVAVTSVVSGVTLLTIGLVIVLSVRLRRDEIMTMSKMGCSRFAIFSILGCQVLIVLVISGVLAVGLTTMTDVYGRELVRWLIL